MVMSRSSAIRTRRWSRVEYDRLIEKGLFEPGERLELISGALVVREPQGSAHATAIELAQDALRAAFGPGWRVRVQLPIALDDQSEPEPDLAVVHGTPRDYRDAHPSRPVLIVEVAEASLSFDRRHKGSLYARAGVADYWIVNSRSASSIRRSPPQGLGPTAGGTAMFRLLTLSSFTPLAAPASAIAVVDLLPEELTRPTPVVTITTLTWRSGLDPLSKARVVRGRDATWGCLREVRRGQAD
jgi:Uma2 family endonuclease